MGADRVGAPGLSPAEFRAALACFASGVTVITADTALGPVGLTATGFTAVSLCPPLILVCVANDASVHDVLVGAPRFAVNILSSGQSALAQQFARSGVDRFHQVPLDERGDGGHGPFIQGALAQLECRPRAVHPEGDHSIVVGEVVFAVVGAGRPLLHFARQFGRFETLG